ncbi:MAG TPA: tetratricopeptide repeat protein [Candidatus Angelobacter sp.]|nr:tetratricopeptide repeat protein [Candidatus Angelobacter sp.]
MKCGITARLSIVMIGIVSFALVTEAQVARQSSGENPSSSLQYLTQKDYDNLTRSAGRVRPEDVSGLEKRAHEGDLNSQLLIGTLYHVGCGIVKRNPIVSLDWYRKAADQDSSMAENQIGIYYDKGPGSDKTEALRWYRRAAAHPDSIAQRNLGVLLAETSQTSEAAIWLHRSAEQGADLAIEELMDLYNDGTANPEKSLGENQKEGRILLQSWAEQGSPGAQTELAISYWLGNLGLNKDATQAFRWMSKAAEKSPEAEAFLGQFYSSGIGTVANDEEAVRYYRKAAEHGDWRGQVNLSIRYQHGHGMTKDPVEAAKWMQAAADQGLPMARYRLAEMYEKGQGVAKDKITAIMWIILAQIADASFTDKFHPSAPDSRFSFNCNPSNKDYQEAERRANEWLDRHLCL